MVGGLGMARAAHVVDENVDEMSSVMRNVSMVDRGASCGGRSFRWMVSNGGCRWQTESIDVCMAS